MRWDDRYRNGEGVGRPPDRFVVHAASSLAPATALDLACGPGRHSLWLAERGWNVTAVDGSSVALELLRESDEHHRIKTVLADLESPEAKLSGEFNLVVQTFFLWRPLWPQIRNAVLPGGHYIAVLPTEGLKRPEYLVSPGELANVFADWSIITERVIEGRAEFFAQRSLT